MSVIGKTLGHYQITSQLGKGGMGEVYQAKDQTLGRDVAIKVLPEEFAKDADRVSRFQREAKLLASLNHPNIAAIHGLEESGGMNFLVLELVEGETLADQIKRGPIPVEESLKLALQIAEALEAAHEKGVIHRDLKPANIKVTPDGKVKVLDFGLAKAFTGEQAELNLSNSPTLTRSPTLSDMATQQGVILGTAAYMSPEQARGKAVDRRADIWAFGCVLYEMLTGRVAFQGEDVSEILAAVLKSEPEWNRLHPNVHPRIRLLLERCLEKEAKNRYHDISDARVDIQKVLADPGGVFVRPIITAEPRGRSRIMLWVSVAVVLTAIAAGLSVWKLKPSEPRQVMRFDFDLAEGQQVNSLAVSPNGKQFVYGTSKGLYLRSVNDLTAKIVAGTEGDTQQPFFSPDGKWIAYFSVADRMLKKISTDGVAPAPICDVAQIQGASWYEDRTIIFGQMPGDIMRISANGGTPESLVKAKIGFLGSPQVLPDGKSVLYTSTTGGTDGKIRVQSLKSGESKELFPGAYAQYLPTGHIAYLLVNNNNLFVVPFDIDKLEVTGGSVPIIAGVLRFAIANNGTMIYLPGSAMANANNQRILVWVDRKGKEEVVDAPPNFYKYPNISPDGTKIAVTDYATGKIHDIWVWNLARKTLTKLTSEGKDNICPVWSPDGKRIAFMSFGRGSNGNVSGVYWKAADGTGQDEQMGAMPDKSFAPYCWSSDGKFLVGSVFPAALNAEHIGMLSMEGDHARKTLLQQPFVERSPKISPDGRWMAYTSNESGREEIYVRPFPDVNKGRWQISTSGGGGPLWSPDGRELFYLSGDAVMAVSVKTGPNFDIVGTPQVLFRGTFVRPDLGEGTPWAPSQDGKRFLMLKPQVPTSATSTAAAPRKINVVLNWFEELKQRVPTGK
jgi:eukaryotic-like serine/threonine-protein kinase